MGRTATFKAGETRPTGLVPAAPAAEDVYADGTEAEADEIGAAVLEESPVEEEVEDEVVDSGYDPSEHTVAEVQEYLEGNPDQSEFVLARERAGKNRVTLVGENS